MQATVVREGQATDFPARELVPSDIVSLPHPRLPSLSGSLLTGML